VRLEYEIKKNYNLCCLLIATGLYGITITNGANFNKFQKSILVGAGSLISIMALYKPNYEFEGKVLKSFDNVKREIAKRGLIAQTNLLLNPPKLQDIDYPERPRVEETDFNPPTINLKNTDLFQEVEQQSKTSDFDFSYLSDCVQNSLLITGRKGAGKSHLLRWLHASWVQNSGVNDVFYIIDPHYDPDEEEDKWLKGLNEKRLFDNGFITNGSGISQKLEELLFLFLKEVKTNNKLKISGRKVRVVVDEIDSLSDTDSNTLSELVKNIEYQGRKYGWSIHLGSHTLKLKQTNLDSSVIASMHALIHTSVATDACVKSFQLMPSLTIIKKQIREVTADYPGERFYYYCNGVEASIVAIPTLTLPLFDTDPFIAIQKLDNPTPEQVSNLWYRITGQKLSPNELQVILDKVGLSSFTSA